MNFRVIDGNDDYLDKINDFVKLYNDLTYSTTEIRKKLDLTANKYEILRKECFERGLICLRGLNGNTAKKEKSKYYSKHGDKYRVSKTINGKKIGFGYYDTPKIAEQMVAELKKVNWDKKELRRIRLKIEGKSHCKFYSKHKSGSFQVRKIINNEFFSYGYYKTEEIADAIVEELIKVDWDKNELDRIKREVLPL